MERREEKFIYWMRQHGWRGGLVLLLFILAVWLYSRW